MSEKPPIPTSIEAQEQTYAALEFAEQTGSLGYRGAVERPRINAEGERGLISSAFARTQEFPDATLSYIDRSVHKNSTQPSEEDRETHAIVDAKSGRYSANITDGGWRNHADVEREDYGQHTFTPANREKAAALITSLAAKRIGKQASEKFDKIAAAHEAYVKKIEVKDTSTPALTIKVPKS